MPINSINNEHELLIQIAEGNQKAFSELFNAYHNQLGEYIYMLTSSEDMTEEIVLDVFVKIWMNRRELTDVKNFSSYIFIITRNLTINLIRKKVNDRKKHNIYSLSHLNEDEYIIAYTEQHKDYTPIIEKAISQLPPQQKKVFILKQEGKKNNVIAAELHISPESVRKYYMWAFKFVSDYVKNHIEVTTILILGSVLLK